MTDNMDSVFSELSGDMQNQFIACFNYYIEKNRINSDQFTENIEQHESKFLELWGHHLILLDSGDPAYGHLVQS